MTELPEDSEQRGPRRSTFAEVAREEFWIVAKSYFAPVYGTMMVCRRLARLTRLLDGKALASGRAPSGPAEPSLTPAE